jgi:hypothetical protein
MNLLSLPDGRIINLEHLTYAERAGEHLALHFDSGAEGGMGSVVRPHHRFARILRLNDLKSLKLQYL